MTNVLKDFIADTSEFVQHNTKTIVIGAAALLGSVSMTSCSNQYMGYQQSSNGRRDMARTSFQNDSRLMTEVAPRSEEQKDKIEAAKQAEVTTCPAAKKPAKRRATYQSGWHMGPF